MIECDESYTCKTCGYCGVIHDQLGDSKVLKCKQENCQQKSIGSDRNIHSARDILLCYLTCNNIAIRVCYLEPADVAKNLFAFKHYTTTKLIVNDTTISTSFTSIRFITINHFTITKQFTLGYQPLSKFLM